MDGERLAVPAEDAVAPRFGDEERVAVPGEAVGVRLERDVDRRRGRGRITGRRRRAAARGDGEPGDQPCRPRHFASITSVDLMTTVTASPFFSPSFSADALVITDVSS